MKGGKKIGVRGDQWYSIDYFDKEHEIKNPAKQATAAVHTVGDYIHRHESFRKRKLRPSFAWAVCFPGMNLERETGLDLPADVVIDAKAVGRIAEAVEKAFAYHNLTGPPLDESAQKAFLSILCPQFRLVPAMTHRLDEDQGVLVRLTEEQAAVLELLEEFPRVAITGPAGTGKTLVGLEKARRLSAEGQPVLFLCYNRPLGEHIQALGEDFKVSWFHKYARDVVTSAGLKFEIPKEPDAQKTFWRDDVADLLIRALDLYPDERFDAVVVDEGQDFQEMWWLAIEKLLVDTKESTLYVFYDPNQNLFGGGPAETLGLKESKLTFNCRNTENIARYSGAAIDLEPRVKHGAPEGTPVIDIVCADEKAMVDGVRKQLHHLINEMEIPIDRIVVMSPLGPNSPLKKLKNLGNFMLYESGDGSAANSVRFVSVRSFKGLEADAIILCDVKPGAWYCSPTDLYVGTSRARHVLVVLRYERSDA